MTGEEILLKIKEIETASRKATINTLCRDCNKEDCGERENCIMFDDCVAAAKDAIILFLYNDIK